MKTENLPEKGLENIKSVNGDTNSLIIELEKLINLPDDFLHQPPK